MLISKKTTQKEFDIILQDRKMIKSLNCSGCPNIERIPKAHKILLLDCSDCQNLESISNVHRLIELICSSCPKLTYIHKMKGLVTLNCSYCTTLKTIPIIEGLVNLICVGCTNLKEIPNIKGLSFLNSSDCEKLEYIPPIEGLKGLVCEGSPSVKISFSESLKEICVSNVNDLTNIPTIKGLRILNCIRCPNLTNIPYLYKLVILDCRFCPKLRISNIGYTSLITICYTDFRNFEKLGPFFQSIKKCAAKVFCDNNQGGFLDFFMEILERTLV